MTKRNVWFSIASSILIWVFGFLSAFIFVGSANTTPVFPLPTTTLPDQASVAFQWIIWQNVRMVLYNISGLITFGSTAAINLVFNGLVFGMTVSDALASGIAISDILRHTLPHSIELLGLWLSGALGLWGAVLGIRYLSSGRGLSHREVLRAVQLGMVSMTIIAIAALLEVEFSIRPLLGGEKGGN